MPTAASSEMPIRISRLAHPLLALGPGIRAGIWTQGCSIRCPGCGAQDTWGRPAESESDVGVVLHWLADLSLDRLDGVTISGGEPTDQPVALRALLDGIRELSLGRDDFDILLYTGRSAEWVMSLGAAIVKGADAVVTDPYIEAVAGKAPLRGSDNQRILPLTELGRTRYWTLPLPDRNQVQIDVVDGEIRMIGIPAPGALAELTRRATQAGLTLRGTSWQS